MLTTLVLALTLCPGADPDLLNLVPEEKYQAYWLTRDPADAKRIEYEPLLLLARCPIDRLANLKQDEKLPLLEALALTAETYRKDSIWNQDRRPFKLVQSFGEIDSKARQLTVNGTRYRYETCPIADVVLLLENPRGKIPLHRLHAPLSGAVQTARALRLLLKEQLAEEEKADRKQIPITVTGKVEPAVVKRGEPIPLSITIANGFKAIVGYFAYSLKSNDRNGETVSLSLVDIYRDGKTEGLFLERPKVEPPPMIAGMAGHPIKAGGSLTVTTDARKWKIVGDWIPGKYKVTVRVERLTVDGDRCVLGVHSAPFEFEIR